MHLTNTLRGWRKVAVVGGSIVAILAAGRRCQRATQASRRPRHRAAVASVPGAQQAPTPKQVDHAQAAAPSAQDQQAETARARPRTLVTGREVTAALYGAVTELVPGEGSEFSGRRARRTGAPG